MNCTYYDAVGCADGRYLLARLLQALMQLSRFRNASPRLRRRVSFSGSDSLLSLRWRGGNEVAVLDADVSAATYTADDMAHTTINA